MIAILRQPALGGGKAVARKLDGVAKKQQLAKAFLLEHGIVRRVGDVGVHRAGDERGIARVAQADHDQDDIFLRVEAVGLQRDAGGKISGAAETADGDVFAAQLADRFDARLGHEKIIRQAGR